MMDDKTFMRLSVEAKEALTKGHLGDALPPLAAITGIVGNGALNEECETIRGDYDRLLRFTLTNGNDDTRPDQHLRLIRKAIGLLQNALRLHRLHRRDDIYSKTWRRYPAHWDDGAEAALDALGGLPIRKAADGVFNLIWTSPQLTADDEDMVTRLIAEAEPLAAAYYVSALGLSLLEYFDNRKLRLLLSLCHSENAETRARALTGACIASQLHGAYICYYPRLAAAFGELCHNAEIHLIQRDICLSHATERIHKRMREQMGGGGRGTMIEKSMRKVTEMLVDGVDLNLEAFAGLKRFPFFGEPCHWLMPFDERHAKREIRNFLRGVRLCDSDKFSICQLLDSLTDERGEELLSHLKGMSDNMPPIDPDGRDIIQTYHNVVQCLSRCLKLSPWTAEWPTVFSHSFLFIDNPALSPCLAADNTYLRKTGEALLKYELYDEAKRHFALLAKRTEGTAKLFRNLAFCEEKEGDLQEATNHYRKALLLSPGNKTLLNRLQACLARQGLHEERLDCLTELESGFPDNEKVTMECGLCLMRLGRWKEAQQRFFKLELGEKPDPMVSRALAWCALQTRDLKLAHNRYQRLAQEEGSKQWEDCLNLAHTLWLEGDCTEALKHYRRYAKLYAASERDASDTLKPFDADADMLRRLGVSQSDVCLIRDIISLD